MIETTPVNFVVVFSDVNSFCRWKVFAIRSCDFDEKAYLEIESKIGRNGGKIGNSSIINFDVRTMMALAMIPINFSDNFPYIKENIYIE